MKPRALSLISGGLDSLLATKLILDQGIPVEGINFFTGFTGDHSYKFKDQETATGSASSIAEQLGIKLHLVDLTQEFKPILLTPKYGYGAHLNPCLDCKLFMVEHAQRYMQELGFDFLITGEVLGQRAKSQRRDTLPLASELTAGLIVRPLSAKLLPATIPEQRGWIQREALYNISGRGRTRQLALAERMGFKNIPQPAGGCHLTDSNFCRRLQDLLQVRAAQSYTKPDILLLRVGRHLRINPELKIIIGRNECENAFIAQQATHHLLFQTTNYPGAVVLLDGTETDKHMVLAAQIAAYFSKGKGLPTTDVTMKQESGTASILTVRPLSQEELKSQWYL